MLHHVIISLVGMIAIFLMYNHFVRETMADIEKRAAPDTSVEPQTADRTRRRP